MIIAIDFDGTCVSAEYPSIGRDIGAVPVLIDLLKAGHQLILNTMRSGVELEDAVEWFRQNDITLYGVNQNPQQQSWTSSPKIFADLYIDENALGAPLAFADFAPKGFIDWKKVRKMLESEGIL